MFSRISIKTKIVEQKDFFFVDIHFKELKYELTFNV